MTADGPLDAPGARFSTRVRPSRSLIPFIVLLVCAAGVGCSHRLPTREVTLVARGMTFMFAQSPGDSNPVIRLRAGERVRLVLKNEAPGLLHDLEIPALNVQLEQIRAGQSTDSTFTVPNKPGRHEYRCRPHSELMHGIVEVTR
jgi:plastocyanin